MSFMPPWTSLASTRCRVAVRITTALVPRFMPFAHISLWEPKHE